MHVMTLTVLINLSFSSISLKFSDKLTTVDLVIVVTSMVINFVVAKIFVNQQFVLWLTLRTGVGTSVEAAEAEVRAVSVRLAGGPTGVNWALTGGGGEGGDGGTGATTSLASSWICKQPFVLLVVGGGEGAVNIEPDSLIVLW